MKCPRCASKFIDEYAEEPQKLCEDCGLIFNSDGSFIDEDNDKDPVDEEDYYHVP